jgi:hypothetical protein
MCDVNCCCKACRGIATDTPVTISNRSGLSAIAYRAGTYAQFKNSLLAGLSVSHRPALQALTTRNPYDFSIALLDAFATMADVLTFYQERIANENYLRTATERESILELAKLIGYELRPGVAAETWLAFTLDSTPGALGPVITSGTVNNTQNNIPPLTIDVGTQVQSIPGPGEQAQTFETIEQIEARIEWNAIKPRLTNAQRVDRNSGLIILSGITNNLKQGDVLLISDSSGLIMKKILNVQIDQNAQTTQITLINGATLPSFTQVQPIPQPNVEGLLANDALNNTVINQIVENTWNEEDLALVMQTKSWEDSDLVSGVKNALANIASSGTIYAFRKRTSIFGYNAGQQITFPVNYPNAPPTWADWDLDEDSNKIYLDNAYDEILPNSFVGIQKSTDSSVDTGIVYPISEVSLGSRTAYGISSKTTLLTLNNTTDWWEKFGRKATYTTYRMISGGASGKASGKVSEGERKTGTTFLPDQLDSIRTIAAYAQTEPLQLAPIAINDTIANNWIPLDGIYPGLRVGQTVIVTGVRSDLAGVTISEAVTLSEVYVEKGYTVLGLQSNLKYSYIRNTVTIAANVALSSHGQSVQEILGSGDASQVFQEFVLKQSPLTYTSDSSASGVKTSLQVRVNNLLWAEVPSLIDQGPTDRVYLTRIDNVGNTSVIFGDGTTGSRLPTGQSNVTATYRMGIGLGGLVKANQLSQLMTRPLGVKAAVNPIAANGAADPEQLEDARSNATLTILTLDRIVSLQDFEDYARAFPGIGKSLATATWDGQKNGVFITVAGANGDRVGDILSGNLLTSILDNGDPNIPVSVASYQQKFFQVEGNIKVDSAYITDDVIANIESQLRRVFSFTERAFGQPVFYSEVIEVMQDVDGVIAVDVDYLYRSDQARSLNYTLAANLPISSATPIAAELLTIDPRPIILNAIT